VFGNSVETVSRTSKCIIPLSLWISSCSTEFVSVFQTPSIARRLTCATLAHIFLTGKYYVHRLTFYSKDWAKLRNRLKIRKLHRDYK
jgi:hypothetical protein